MMQYMILRQDAYPPNAVYKLAFIDACTLFGLAVLYILALHFRKNLKPHRVLRSAPYRACCARINSDVYLQFGRSLQL